MGTETFTEAERLILETLTHAYPVGLNKEEVAARAGYDLSSRTILGSACHFEFFFLQSMSN
jgi:hypothetical protein